jgi:hypothetical protein
MNLLRWWNRYTAHDDPRTAAASLIALLIVSNQPFYPFYYYFAVGNGAWVTLITFLSTPFFFAVPALARRNALAGRIGLCVVGTLNTFNCMWAFGEQSGVALFLLPCIMLGVLLFRASERGAMAFCAGLPMAGFLLLHNRFGAPLHVFSEAQYSSLVTLHSYSVGGLTAFIGYLFSTRIAPDRT